MSIAVLFEILSGRRPNDTVIVCCSECEKNGMGDLNDLAVIGIGLRREFAELLEKEKLKGHIPEVIVDRNNNF